MKPEMNTRIVIADTQWPWKNLSSLRSKGIGHKLPVILDTDPGTDIDDSYALAMLLNSPELDLKLITTATGDTQYRGAVAARILEAANRTDIPIAPGRKERVDKYQYTLADYLKCSGEKHYAFKDDAVSEIVRVVTESAEPVTLIAIAPATNLGDLLDRAPQIAGKIDLIGMLGSVNKGCDNKPGRIAEYNVVRDIEAARKVFAAPWRSFRITPLDTCGSIRLTREEFCRMRDISPVMHEVAESNWHWDWWKEAFTSGTVPEFTSVMFDTVAVYIALGGDLLEFERRGFSVGDDGKLIDDDNAPPVWTALRWKDFDAYHRLLTEILCRTADKQ